LPFILFELAHATLDHLAEALGNADLELLQRCAQLPPFVVQDDEPPRDELLDEAHHEQGIALGSPDDDGRQLGGKRVPGEALAQVVDDRRLAQQFQ